MLQTIDGLVLLIAEKGGSPEEKELINLLKSMKELLRLLKNSPFVEFARSLRALPEGTFAALIEKTTITLTNLEGYLTSKGVDLEGGKVAAV